MKSPVMQKGQCEGGRLGWEHWPPQNKITFSTRRHQVMMLGLSLT